MKKQKILVVGGCGYIGTHMVKALLGGGYDVVTLDNLSSGHLELLPGGEFIQGDISDRQLLDHLFKTYRIDAVMHFAALIEVGESVRFPLKYYRNNIAGTVSLLDAMVEHGISNIIFSSTAAVYGEPDYTPIDEKHVYRPTTPYGNSKLVVEQILKDCAAAHGLNSICLRYFNAAGADASAKIGERHTPESHLIPLVLQVAAGQCDSISIFGNDHATPDGTCLRDYVHVNDLAAAHLLALQRLQKGGASAVYNLGNSHGYSVLEVIETARRITDHPIPAIVSRRRAGDPAVLVAASDRARTHLGWRPQYDTLEAIIDSAWKWHKNE